MRNQKLRDKRNKSNAMVEPDEAHANVIRGGKTPYNVTILLWFLCLIPTLDHMPDLPFYQCPAPDRKVVHGWYVNDHQSDPETWPYISYSHFLNVWRNEVSNVRLRKYSRFTKCSICTKFKADKSACRGRGNSVPISLIDNMNAHYQKIRRFRSDAAHRAKLAATHPEELYADVT